MDEVIELLIRAMMWPFRVWKDNNENSRVGVSGREHAAEKFWAAVAMGGIALLSLLAIVFWIFF